MVQPSPGLHLVVHQDARGWQPTGDALRRLREITDDPDFTLRYWPRSMAEVVTKKAFPPYAFRAWRHGLVADIFVDGTETPASIAWLSAHELGHLLVEKSPTLKAAFEAAECREHDPASDAFHEYDPEERFCDGLATRAFGQRLDRRWWRQNTRRKA